MNPLFAAAVEVLTFCQSHGWRGCVIGLAVQRWGEPRQTRDVDVTLLSGLGGEERFVDALLTRFRPRLPDARRFALERRVLLIESDAGVPLDVSLGGLPYEARVIDRATPFEPEATARFTTCSAEDLVVLKAFAGRPLDWVDVEGILVRQGPRLDRTLVLDELARLLELADDTAAAEPLRSLFRKHP